MEKHESRSSTRDISRSVNIPNRGIPGRPGGKPAENPRKPSREDISRCINIWARVYRLQENSMSSVDLCLPSRPWIGRNPNSLKRFE